MYTRAVLLVLLLLPGAIDSGLEAQQSGDRWRFIVSPYFLAPNMKGTTAVGPSEVEVDADPGDVFDRLQFGAMLNVEARRGRWAIALDASYMDLSQTSGPLTADVSQGALMLALYRRVAPWAEVMVGGQFNGIDLALQGSGAAAVNGERDASWFDPLLGVRIATTESDAKKWRFALQAHVGGFGIGSDFAWQVYPQVGFRLSRLLELTAAYRFLGMDYEEGTGSERFLYDVTTFGPQLGLAFHF